MPPLLVKNRLLSRPFVDRLAALRRDEAACKTLVDVMTGFEKMKDRASEIQTELHLVKPILKVLGYAFESKPQFFEEKVKGADFALFPSEEERVRSGPLWGTRPYYDKVLALALVKRYGRNLEEGISGFYLEFESRIPLYQSMYLSKKAGVPWSILTNGQTWLLLKRPFALEKSLVEIDLERAIASGDDETIHLFYQMFSASGLDVTLPALLEEERTSLIAFLQGQRKSCADELEGASRSPVDVAVPLYRKLFPEGTLAATEGQGGRPGRGAGERPFGKAVPVKEYDQCEVFTYLLARGTGPETGTEEVILGSIREERTKERLMSLRILDMTPGFGALATRLVETIAYLSFLLPYREKRSFVAEWENEALLQGFILDRLLYGVVKHPFALDVLQNGLRSRFNVPGANYRLGNGLLGMSLRDLFGQPSDGGQTTLFSKGSGDVLSRLKETYRTYSTLSERIKEDAAVKAGLGAKLAVFRQRIGEVMDMTTASYFEGALEAKKIGELLYYIDGDEEIWRQIRAEDTYARARDIARRKHFFHMEIEFPFLLNDGFDLIFVQPSFAYLWEEKVPAGEVTKAYIKRAMAYLKQGGAIVLLGADQADLVSELKRSRRYSAEAKEGIVTVKRH